MNIGFWVSSFDSHVIKELYRKVEQIANARGHALTVFNGATLNDGKINSNKNKIFNLSRPPIIDGLICWTSILASYTTKEIATSFILDGREIPIVSIGMDIPGAINLFPDDYQGAYDSVVHLIRAHGFTRIACFTGAQHKESARKRYQGYCDALQHEGIAYDPALVILQNRPGIPQTQESLVTLGDKLFTTQAIVAFNDQTAGSILACLKEKNLRVPQDIAVVGFDNIPASQFFVPPLTTVAMPVEDMAQEAIERLEATFHGNNFSGKPLSPSRLIIRNSCGCGILHKVIPLSDTNNADYSLENLIQQAKGLNIFSQLTDREVKKLLGSLSETLTTTLCSSRDTEEPVKLFRQILEQITTISHYSLDWQKCISLLRTHMLSGEMGQAAMLKAEDFFHIIREIAAEYLDKLHFEHDATKNKKSELLSRLAYDLLSHNNFETIWTTIATCLGGLQISQLHIAMVDGLDTPTTMAKSMFHYSKQSGLSFTVSRQNPLDTFPARLLVPESLAALRTSHNLMVFPLVTETDVFAIACAMVEPANADVIPRLQQVISAHLAEMLAHDEHRVIVEELEKTRKKAEANARESREMYHLSIMDELTRLYNRRGFMSKYHDMKHDPVQTGVLTLFFLDMDNLKTINDHYGHEDGDSAIKACAEILGIVFRSSDVVARMGGDEFAVIARGLGPNRIVEIQQRIHDATKQVNQQLGKPYTISFSSGFSHIAPDDPRSIEQILSDADAMLYQEKRSKKTSRQYIDSQAVLNNP